MATKKKIVQNNRQDFINLVSKKLDTKKNVSKKAVDGVLEVIGDILAKGESLSLIGFGRFHVADRAARVGRNPKTGEKITIKASKTPRFSPGKLLKDAVNTKNKK